MGRPSSQQRGALHAPVCKKTYKGRSACQKAAAWSAAGYLQSEPSICTLRSPRLNRRPLAALVHNNISCLRKHPSRHDNHSYQCHIGAPPERRGTVCSMIAIGGAVAALARSTGLLQPPWSPHTIPQATVEMLPLQSTPSNASPCRWWSSQHPDGRRTVVAASRQLLDRATAAPRRDVRCRCSIPTVAGPLQQQRLIASWAVFAASLRSLDHCNILAVTGPLRQQL